MSFSQVERNALISHSSDDALDLVVVGGGITGAGIAHDAAVRGLSVALVEKNDFASGTSSRSSSLIHGGLRYLEQLNFKLVFEAVQERALLTKLAPHLVQPIPFLFPVYKGDRVGLFTMRMGLTLYESLAFFKTYKRHHVYRKEATLNVEPELLREGLKGSISYYDCMTSDARLTLETMIAAQRAGARVGNYLRVKKIAPRDAQSRFRLEIHDEEGQRDLVLRAYTVINAGGPWSDDVRRLLENDQDHLIRPTKGVHVVVPKYRLPVRHAVVMTSREDKRIIFAIPWPNATVIGTTDTDYDESIDEIIGDSHDIGYLLEITNHYFPDARLGREDIISTWAGVRPLIREEGLSAGDTSREHELRISPEGLIS
ncbi:MAG: glycerol-3-phosphate dehydrogenase/oxidase, partial [Myxococcales bacterium]|nr:glycerol-3-phosphate dehydrogenase/oxidase [Myxococcales bacterium]